MRPGGGGIRIGSPVEPVFSYMWLGDCLLSMEVLHRIRDFSRNVAWGGGGEGNCFSGD